MPRKQNASLDLQGEVRVINTPSPVNPGDSTPKSWVEEKISASEQTIVSYIEQPVRAVATVNINTASPGTTIDGVALAANNRILLTEQTEPKENGTWIWHTSSSALTRTTDTFKNGAAVVAGSEGTTHGKTIWVQTVENAIVGTTALHFTNVGALSIAGTGLESSGQTISLTVPVTVAHGGTGAVTATAALAALGGTTAVTAQIGNGALTSFTVTHTLHSAHPLVILVNNSTNAVEDCKVVYTSSTEVTLSGEAWETAPPASNAYTVVLIG